MPRLPILHRLHRQLGLWLGAPLALLAFTGAVLAFRPELSRAMYPAVFASQDCDVRLPLSAATGNAAARNPRLSLIYVEDMQTPCVNAFAVAVPVVGAAEAAPSMLGLDLATGEPAGRMLLSDNLLNLALTVHTTFLAGPSGRLAVGIFGAVLAFAALSGIWVWARGQSRRLGAHLQRTYRIRSRYFAFDSHRAVGVSLALLLVLTAITGFSMSYDKQLQPVISWALFAPPRPTPEALLGGGNVRPGTLDLAEALQRTERLLPEARPSVAGFAGPESELVYVRARFPGDNYRFGRSMVFFDRATGEPMALIDARKEPMSWFLALEAAWTVHAGTALGTVGRTFMLLAGFGLCTLFMLGARLWWRRTRKR